MLEHIINNKNIEQSNYLNFKIEINFNKKANILYRIIIDSIIDNNKIVIVYYVYKIVYKKYIYKNVK
jgi:hypothetical protein